MEEILKIFKNKKNLINLLILGILILALPLGIGLVRTQQILRSRAVVEPIVFTGPNVFTLPDGKKAFKLNDKGEALIGLQITSPIGPPAGIGTTAPGILTQGGLISTVYADDCDPDDPEDDSCHEPPPPSPSPSPSPSPPPPPPTNHCLVAGYHVCTVGVPSGGVGSCTLNGRECTAFETFQCKFNDQDYCGPPFDVNPQSCGEPCRDTSCQGESRCAAFWGSGAGITPGCGQDRGDGCFGGLGASSPLCNRTQSNCTQNGLPGTQWCTSGNAPGVCLGCFKTQSGDEKGCNVQTACEPKVEEARKKLIEFGGNFKNATCQQIIDKVKSDCTIFVPPNAIRDALAPGTCGTTQCPANVEEARRQLIAAGGNFKNATCQQIIDKVKSDCTIFKPPNPIRDALAPGTCAPSLTTTHFRFAETRAGLTDVAFEVYDAEVEERDIRFKDKTLGPKLVFVEFKGSDNKTVIRNAQIELVVDPKITGCSTKLLDDRVEFILKGENFAGKGTAKSEDIAKGDKKDLTVKSWKDTEIVASLQGPPVGQTFPIFIKNDKGLEADSSCSSIAQLSLGAKLFCRAPQQFDADEVQIVIAEGVDKGRVSKEKVKINKKGVVEGLTARLVEGQGYKISVKAPKSLRRGKEFIVKAGTTILADFNLPVGDIFPLAEGDGKINAADKAQLNREWRLIGATTVRSGDFNGDGLVNSFDWACMRQDFGQSDDDEPIPGPLTTITPTTRGPIGIGTTSPSGVGTTGP